MVAVIAISEKAFVAPVVPSLRRRKLDCSLSGQATSSEDSGVEIM